MLLRAAARASARSSYLPRRAAICQNQWSRTYAKDEKPKAVPKSSSHIRASAQSTGSKGPVQNRTWAPDKPIRFSSPAEEAKSREGSTVLQDQVQEPIITSPPPTDAVEFTDLPSRAAPRTTSRPVNAVTQQTIISPPPPADNVNVTEPLKVPPSQMPSASMPITASDSISNSPSNPAPPTESNSAQQSIITPPPPADNVNLNEPLRVHPSEMRSEHLPPSHAEAETPVGEFQSKVRQDSERSQDGTDAAGTSPLATGPLPDLRHGIPSSFESQTSDRSSSFKDKDSESPSLDITEDPARAGGRRARDDQEQYYTSIDRRRNAYARWAYIGFGAFALTGALYLGQNWSEEEARLHPDAPNGFDPSSFWARIKSRLAPTLGYYTEPSFPKLLPDVDPAMRPSPYTLVLSLEDLLVSSTWTRKDGWKVAKRPGVDYFIRYIQQYYELAIFTTVPYMNAEMIVRKLDPFRLISWPLFREATRYMNGDHVKDLSYLNRDLSKTLIIDTVPAHVQLQPENAIILPKWKGGSDDTHTTDLVALIPFLEYIASMSIDDVRKVLKSYEGKHIPTEFHRREQLAREAFNKKLAEEKSRHGGRVGGASVWGSLSSSLGIKAAPPMMAIPGEQSPAEALAQGKMLSDQIRERGLKNYEHIEREIQLHGEEWLKESEREEKKFQEEQMKSMQSGMTGMFGGLFGGGGGGASERK